MMIRFQLALLVAVLMYVPAQAQSGGPAIAYTASNLNMRTGPGTNYPVITTLPRGANVTVFGCTPDYSWCDAAFVDVKGWVSGRYLSYGVRGSYYGQPLPRTGVIVGVPRYTARSYTIYPRPRVVARPARPAPYRGYPRRFY